MKLTTAQFNWLKWLDAYGGKAHLYRGYPCVCTDQKHIGHAGMAAPMAFIGLVAAGAVDGEGGYIRITPAGRLHVHPFAPYCKRETASAPMEDCDG